jgi:lipoprotein NlpI
MAYLDRALVRGKKGDLQGAINDYGTAIAFGSKGDDVYYRRANLEAADYRHYCDLSPEDQQFPRMYIWLMRARLGETEAANKELSDYLAKLLKDEKEAAPDADNGGDPEDAALDAWVSKVGGFLLGRATEADLLAAATSTAAISTDPKVDSALQCQAWYFTGMKKLLAGDKKAAAECFHKCLATGMRDVDEYQLAQSELKALGQ